MFNLPGVKFSCFLTVLICLLCTFFPASGAYAAVVISSHTDSPDPVAAHAIVTYAIVVSNNDLGAGVSNVTLTDTLPASVLFVDITPPAGVTCGGVAAGSTGTVTCTGLSLSASGTAGDSATYVVRARTTAASRAAGTIINSATATDGITPFTQPESTTVNAGSDVALTKSAGPSPVVAGGIVSYTYSLTNNGPDTASTMVISDSLPPNCIQTGVLPAGCSIAGQLVTCNVASLVNGVTSTITPIQCVAGVAGGSTLTNTANVTVGGASPDNLTANNTSTVNTPVTAGTDVSLVKTKSLATVFVGDSFDFILTPMYSGDFPVGATLTDIVPAQFAIISPASFSQNGWNCTVSGQTLSCIRAGSGSAGVNQPLGVVNLSVTANTAGSFSNTAGIAAPAGVTDPTPGNNSSTLGPFTVSPLESNFSSTKTRTVPNAVSQNVPFDYTLAARNNGLSAFTGTVTLTDTLPAGFTLNSYGAASGFSAAGCTPLAASLPVAGPVNIVCSRAVVALAANTSAGSIVINVTPTALGTLNNTVCVSTTGGTADFTAGDDCSTNGVDSQLNTDQADLTINKIASPATVLAGQPLTYTVEVVNAGPQTAQNAQVTDVLADLINGSIGAGQGVEGQPVIASGTATVGSCSIVSTGGASAQLNCTITALPVCTPGSDCPKITFIVRPAASTNPGDADVSRTNTASVLSQITADSNLGNNSGSVTTDVSPRVDMSVTKTGSLGTVPVGQNLTYTITARNNGPSRASGVSVTDTLPNDVTFISASASNGGACTTTPAANSTTSAVNNTLICSWGSQFTVGQQRTVTVLVRPNAATRGTVISNSVIVDSSTTETNAGNNSATATTIISNPVYDLLTNKVDDVDPLTVGDDVTYTVTVTNNGASYAENVRVVDTFPSAGLSFRSVTPVTAGVSCSTTASVGVAGGTATCNVPGLATLGTAQFQVVLRGEAKGTYNNVAISQFQNPAEDAYDPQANNTATQPTTVRTKADVQIASKQAVQTGTATPQAQVELRRSFDWLVNIQNNGPAEADVVTFSDTLPSGMELTGPPAFTVTSGSFTPAGPTCTGAAGATAFTCSITSMPASGTATIRIPVRVITAPGGGTTTNTATLITTGSFDTNGGSSTVAGNNFGAGSITVLSSSLSGTVYRDINDNGIVNGGEAGIPGATIAITGTVFDGSVVSRTATTDAGGNFSLTGLPESNATGYTLTETGVTLPAGYVDGRESLSGTATGTIGNDQFTGVVLAANTALSGYLFGEAPGITISGSALNDVDTSGTGTVGDTAISGVTLALTGINDRGQSVNCTTTTNASGVFSFTAANCTNLRASDVSGYTLTETQLAPYLPGTTLVGTASGVGSSAGTQVGGVRGDVIQGIILSPGGTSINNTFLEVRPLTIGGSVYFDVNGNALKDGGETVGVPGTIIVFSGINDLAQTINCSITTGAGGAYLFPNVADPDPLCRSIRPGTYSLTETKPAGVSSTGAQPGIPVKGTASSTATTQVVSNIVVNGAGGTLANYNFGHQGTALGGSVYIDTNNNGQRDAGEPGIQGVTVTLSGTAEVGGSVCSYITCAAVTDVNGFYSYAGVPGSDSTGYIITEQSQTAAPLINYADGTDSAGAVAGAPTGSAGNDILSGIIITTGQVGADYNFGELAARVAGTVYYDANNDGVQSGVRETGLAGITVTLSGTDASGNPVVRIAVTDLNGNYVFQNLPGSNGSGYTVTVTQPVNYSDGIKTVGTSAGAAGVRLISGIVLPPGASATGYGFGERLGALSGNVYYDANNNGTKDAGETGIAGTTIALSGTAASGVNVCTILSSCTAVTDANGNYAFSDLPNGNPAGYAITETQSAGYLDGIHSKGLVDGVSCAACSVAVSNVVSAIPMVAGSVFTGFNFGELQGASISGTVYMDLNGNNVKDSAEGGIAGATVTLTGTDDLGNPVSRTVTTAADGTYSIIGLRPSNGGGYTITETQPAGYTDFAGNSGTMIGTISGLAVGSAALNSVSGIVLLPGQSGISYDFREVSAAISGSVYLDSNNNGSVDAGEAGIAGVLITLTGTDNLGAAVSRNTITAADGSYRFDSMIGGTYTLTETHPVIYEDGREAAGSAGGIVDNTTFSLAVVQNRISTIVLSNGVNASGYQFGERPGLAAKVSGTVWFNSISRDQTQQSGEPGLTGWIVEAVRGGVVLGSAATASDGSYEIPNLPAGSGYELRFRHPSNNAVYGDPVSQDSSYLDSTPDYTNHTIANLILRSGANIAQQNLPVDPSGVIYDSVTRNPVTGATVTISGPAGFNAATHLVGGVVNQNQITAANGFYQFLLLPTAPAGTYTLVVTTPPGYVPGISSMIPPTAGPFNPGLGGGIVSVQAQPTAPTGVQSTVYYTTLLISGASNGVINNHLPIDPILGGALVVTKRSPLVNVTRGDLVPYTIEALSTIAATLANIDMIDQLPPGFKYRSGSARVNGVAIEPVANGRNLRWANLTFAPNEKKVITLVLVVGTGVGEGNYTNQAWGINNIVNSQVSNVGEATVRIVPDPTFDCTDIIGKVFNDKNANGYHDQGEEGIPNVRVATARGWLITTDAEGRFHVACAAIPNADRGSNFVIKLDERTLPSGFRVTTENPRVVRATRGKMVKLNFGAAIHRVVRIEVGSSAFRKDDDTLQPEWQKRFDLLPDQMLNHLSVVRFAYRVEKGKKDQAEKRIETLSDALRKRWEALGNRYPLSIEVEFVEVGK